jgi:hypothetical protein
MTGARILRWSGLLVLGGLLLLLAFAAVWRVQGGRIERVETPSMGTVAPVGSLLWVKPVDVSTLRPGDFITFHPPGRPDTTFSHRVYGIDADGTIRTKGVISAPDPWQLQASDVVGSVRMTWPVAGWLVRMGPVLALGGFLVALVASRLDRRWRGVVALVGASLVVAIAITVYRPFLRADQLAFAPDHVGATATYVSTGLLPVRLEADPGGARVVLSDGEVGSVHVPFSDESHRYAVHLAPAVPRLFWIVLVVICFVPALVDSGGRLIRRRTQAAPPV